MMVYRRKGRSAWFIAVPTADGGRVKRSCLTSHRPTARAMERMLEELGPRGRRASASFAASIAGPRATCIASDSTRSA